MIHVQRPKKEPVSLKRQRKLGLAKAFAAFNLYGAGSKELNGTLTDYDGGKEEIFLAQHKKCAFCDRRSLIEAHSLEHFRPKAKVWRHLPGETPGRVEAGSWWLTWTWANHLFSCSRCNSGKKLNYFPLAAGSTTLTGPGRPYKRKTLLAAHQDATVETALLVDPASEDPLDHIEWKPVDPSLPKTLWKWSASPVTPKGEATIKVFGLIAHAADVVGPHLRDYILRDANRICAHVDKGQHDLARAEWESLTKSVTRTDCDLAGATWSALHHLVDEARRKAAGLTLPPRPGLP